MLLLSRSSQRSDLRTLGFLGSLLKDAAVAWPGPFPGKLRVEGLGIQGLGLGLRV